MISGDVLKYRNGERFVIVGCYPALSRTSSQVALTTPASSQFALTAPFARFILDAAYEVALLAALRNMRRGGSNKVLLTLLGGSAFGNRPEWIDDAIRGALEKFANEDLEVLLVSYGQPPESMVAIERQFAGG